MKTFLLAAGVMLMCSCSPRHELVIGTYGEHLYRCSFDGDNLTVLGSAEAVNPSYALACDGGIFAVSEAGDGSGMYSFNGDSFIKTAELHQTGADPCFIMVYEGKYLMTADYSGGSVSVFPIVDGVLGSRVEQLAFEGCGPVIGRQESSHIHQLKVLPGRQEYILASDLGADVIRLMEVSCDASGLTHANGIEMSHVCDIACPPGSGPRHMEFSKDGKFMYCIAELSGEVLVYEISEQNGMPAFCLIQQIQADEVNAGGSADIHIHPSGKWLYTSHRLDNDGIAIFEILQDGTLEKTGYARTARHPRNFMITADGHHLLVACRDDKVIQVFSIGPDGCLALQPARLHFDTDMPSSIVAVSEQ